MISSDRRNSTPFAMYRLVLHSSHSMALHSLRASAARTVVYSKNMRAPTAGYNWLCLLEMEIEREEMSFKQIVSNKIEFAWFNAHCRKRMVLINSAYHIVPNTWFSWCTDKSKCPARRCNCIRRSWQSTWAPIDTRVDVVQWVVWDCSRFVLHCRWSSSSVVCLRVCKWRPKCPE